MSINLHAAHPHPRFTRRQMLSRLAGGLGLAAIASGATHHPAKAKRLIYIVLNGGLSQVDTFDPKPQLSRYNGQPVPGGAPKTERATGALMQSPFRFLRASSCGTAVSEIFPRLATLMDDCCVIRSMYTDVPNHEPSLFLLNCGAIQPGRPSLGSWLMYGLGTENHNLPGFVVLCPGIPVVGPPLWSSAFLPAVFQGTFLKNESADPYALIRHILPQADSGLQRRQLDLLARLNRQHAAARDNDSQLEGSIAAMETAFRMQTEAPEAFDVRLESEATRARYGDSDFGRSCLMARRLVERGVRMVQIYYGNSQPWDNHADILVHQRLAAKTDPAVASLLEDLKSRGLLDDTLVVLGTEFGRTPAVETGASTPVQYGRDHNSYGYSVVLAGGGVKGGITYGATDDFGFRAVEHRTHNHDLNATLLHLLGLDHTRLTYNYSGRDFRLTDVHGEVVHAILR